MIIKITIKQGLTIIFLTASIVLAVLGVLSDEVGLMFYAYVFIMISYLLFVDIVQKELKK